MIEETMMSMTDTRPLCRHCGERLEPAPAGEPLRSDGEPALYIAPDAHWDGRQRGECRARRITGSLKHEGHEPSTL